MSVIQDFGSRLRLLRKSLGLNQINLAELVDVSLKTVQRWESNERQPRSEEVKKLAQVLNVSETELLNGIQPERWVLQIKIADDFKREVIDMTKNMPCVAAITGNPYGANLQLSGSWETFADDDKFMDFIEQVMNSRDAILQLRNSMAGVWDKRKDV